MIVLSEHMQKFIDDVVALAEAESVEDVADIDMLNLTVNIINKYSSDEWRNKLDKRESVIAMMMTHGLLTLSEHYLDILEAQP